MNRCTSPIGWIPLIIYKIVKEKALVPLIISFFIIAIPSLVVFIIIDTIYYDWLTFAPYNFIYKNLVEDVSSDFGISPPFEYFTRTFPHALKITGIFVLIGIYY
jgi:hypothetical protein